MHANHFGLVGMSERVAWLGGQFAMQTHPGSGTTITVQLPLERDSDNDTAT
jgi:signal transduction histidine kinase